MADPAVSICIPTYNYRRYLSDALDSAIAQTFADIEIVVVDNCSDDGTPELVSEYCRRDHRVVFHRNAGNIGMTGNFNRAMELARGQYVKFLCADDVLAPDCVERMTEAIESDAGVALAACRRYRFGPGGSQALLNRHANAPYRRTDGRAALQRCFFQGNYLGEPTAVMFRKADAVEGFNPSYSQAFDLELWFRLLEKGDLAYFDAALCGIRLHDSTGTSRNLRDGKVTEDKIRLFHAYADKPYMDGGFADKLTWDARMAASVSKQIAAGASDVGQVAVAATYYPKIVNAALIPLARLMMKLRHGP